MQIHYSTNFGKFEKHDFSVTEVTATVPVGEHFDALNQGFLFLHGKWRLVRSVRINIEKTDYSMFSGAVPLDSYNMTLDRINEKYLAYKGYEKHNHDTIIDDKDILWGFYSPNLCAWSKVRVYNGAMEAKYFAWDYAKPSLRLGFKSLEHEISIAKELGHKYYYLGPGYETCSKYKCELDGFEWFTGSNWSTNKDLYKEYCDYDSSINSFDDYSAK